jgi:hypothetical protein
MVPYILLDTKMVVRYSEMVALNFSVSNRFGGG